MSKRFKPDKRVIFPVRQQHRFLLRVKEQLDFSSWIIFAKKIGAHPRTLNDWKREEYSIPLGVVKKVSRIAKVKIPKNVKIKEPFWYVYKGAKIGGKLGALACFKKYGSYGGNPEYRKKKWYEWWEREGKYKCTFINECKPIRKPGYSENLAEFVGIVLGDGGITQRQITITLNGKDDVDYIEFVGSLIKKLFDVPVGFYRKKGATAINLNVSRSELVRFCVEKLGLKRGNKIKQQVDIPDWIKRSKNYAIACVRGLVDTDGCIFTHRYRVNGKLYKYKKLCFTSYSKPLRQSVFKILKNNGLNPRMAASRDIRLDSVADMKKYFRIFSFHNYKHIERYKNWKI